MHSSPALCNFTLSARDCGTYAAYRCCAVQVARLLVSARDVCDGGIIETKPELSLLQLTSHNVDMDVLLVRNEAEGVGQGVDRAQLQRDKLVKPLLDMSDAWIAYLAKTTMDRSRERGVMEALTRFVQEHHTTANQAVRLFKVRCPEPACP